MVKNTKGGSGHRSQASKHVISSKNVQRTRIAKEEGEVYARVTAMLGNGMCHVEDTTGGKHLCIIRGKFRGRGKKDNVLSNGMWVLVGIREFESVSDNKLPKCDLLEVYNDFDKDKLKTMVNINWSSFVDKERENAFIDKSHADLEFTSEKEEDYIRLMELEMSNSEKKESITMEGTDEEEVDIDDI